MEKEIYYWEDGDIYEGNYKKAQREGFGIMYYNNGNMFKVMWKNGNKGGYGTLYYNNGEKEEAEG